jgi:hypothetical protein
LVFLRDRGYTNFSANPAAAQFAPGYLNPASQVQQPVTQAQYGANAPQYGQPNTLS